VDERDWLTSNDPAALLRSLPMKASDRDLRLFACACCRILWGRIGSISQEIVAAAEPFAEGEAPAAKLVELYGDGDDDPDYGVADDSDYGIAWIEDAARWTSDVLKWAIDMDRGSRFAFVALLRDVFGNPFRPVVIKPAWLTPTVMALARAAYDERLLPSGELDRDRLLVLADALEEAGAVGELLDHLRSPGPHVWGCFVVDALLGKE
jgi:hypothetical protein